MHEARKRKPEPKTKGLYKSTNTTQGRNDSRRTAWGIYGRVDKLLAPGSRMTAQLSEAAHKYKHKHKHGGIKMIPKSNFQKKNVCEERKRMVWGCDMGRVG